MLRPDSKNDGPVVIYLNSGHTKQFDRLVHNQSGMVTGYNVHRFENQNRIEKGDTAETFPRERIEKIEYIGYGPE